MTEIINPQLGQDGRAYYTIAMPTDPAQADILREFVQAQGWGVVQTVPPVQECVQRQDFLRTSREHWMAGHYGQLAYDILSAELPKLPGAQTHEPRRGALYRNSEGAVYLPAVRHLPELTVVDDTRPEVIRDLFLGRWEDATVPYPVAVNPAEAGPIYRGLGSKILDIRVGQPTQTELAPYTHAAGYVHHGLHGALGKALDVLCAAAGTTTQTRRSERTNTVFVDYSDLVRYKRVSQTGWELLRNTIKEAVYEQLSTGQPLDGGEIILEGSVDLALKNFRYQRIALVSLVNLARGFRSNNPLHQFLDEVERSKTSG